MSIINIELNKFLGHHIDLSIIPEECIFFDIGASNGNSCLAFKEYRPNSKILSFEINKLFIDEFKKNCKDINNVELIEKAVVGNSFDKTVKFYHFDGNYERGNVAGVYTYRKDVSSPYDVETIRFNDIFDIYKIEYADYVKIDAEGAELDIFDSITDDILEKKIGQINVEIHENTDPLIIIKKLSPYFNLFIKVSGKSGDIFGWNKNIKKYF